MARRQLRKEDYTVGWVCALPIELAAAQEMLDEEHCRQQDHDTIYTLGQIGSYNVVIAGLPGGQTGTISAAVVAAKMIQSFKSIRIGLMVGIGGGVPSGEADVRLGDVVISKPHNVHGGVVQYDFGKTTPNGFERTGSLNTPPTILLNAVTNLQANHIRGRCRLLEYFTKLDGLPAFAREGAGQDILFEAAYNHEGTAQCMKCSKDHLIPREPRGQEVIVHYGTIASGNHVIRDGIERDRLSAQLGGVLCFEMEAAGLMNSFPCLVIRGICDYADSHKNKKWQAYAAGTAAACAKEILSVIPPGDISETRKAELVVASYEFLPLLYQNACLYDESKIRNSPRVPGTCEWFINHDLFKQWDSAPNSGKSGLLYVTADPGCGKSVLSRYLIDDILPKTGRTICFFFFKEDFEDQRSSLKAICSILHQIFVSNRHLLTDDILQRYIERGKRFFESFENLWAIFLLAADSQEISCVLDALDECRDEDRKQLINAITSISDIRSNDYGRLKFLITSRPYQYIRAQLLLQLKKSMALIHLQGDEGSTADAIVQEIQLVLDNRIDETAGFFCLEPDERALMKTKLGSIPNRTYLWITLIFDGLMNRKLGVSKSDIISLVTEPPHSVYDAYEKILNKSPDLRRASRLLHIIIGAVRPLSLPEAAIALALQDDQSPASVSERIIPDSRIRGYVRDLCGLFVIIVDEKLYLLHQTAREFLVKYDEGEPRNDHNNRNLEYIMESYTWRHSISVIRTNTVLASTCISYLRSHIAAQYPSLLRYAAIYWAAHYRESSEIYQTDMADTAGDLCLPSEARSRWEKIYKEHTKSLTHESPLCLASGLGLEKVVELFLIQKFTIGVDSKSSVSSKHSLRQLLSRVKPLQEVHEALLLAAGNGRSAVVNLLLQTHLDVNWKDEYGNTSLFYAAAGGFEVVAKVLLQNNANVDSKNTRDETPLSCAAINGQEGIVKLLLSNNADAQWRDNSHRTPLLHAARNGSEAIVKILLETGAQVDAKDSVDRTPLSYAAENGSEAMVKLLLKTGQANIDSKDKDGNTPLFYAAGNGREAIIKVLLQSNADVNLMSNNGQTPLWSAIFRGKGGAAKLLIETGQADANAESYLLGQAPLWYAASVGHEGVVEMLLKANKADVDRRDTYYRETALQSAVRGRHEAVVKLLLQSGRANVNVKDKHGLTPLSHAAMNGHMAMVKLILDTRLADVDSKDKRGWTPLSYATARGYWAVAKLLLEAGRANIHAEDNYGQVPLSHAAAKGHDHIVGLLLDVGRANVDWKDEYYGRTPLSHAAANGHNAVVKLLLETREVDINSADEYCRSPLSYAAANGHELVTGLLLETAQVDVNSEDIFGRTPLSYAVENNHDVIVQLLQSFGAR